MNNSFKNIVALKGQFFPLSWLMVGKKHPPFLPFYHIVSDQKPDYINSYVVRNPQVFEKELDYLLKHFKAVDLREIIEAPAKNKMHLSFDDGLKECHSLIAPILKRKGIPATFFVSPGFIDNKALFHRFKRAILENKGIVSSGGKRYHLHHSDELDQLAKQHQIDFSKYKPYLTFEQLQSLYNDGFTIGAHSMNHPEMWLLNEEEQLRQVTESMQWVIEHFNPVIRAFSFPFTDDGLSLSFFNKIAASGLVDVTFGTAGLKYDMAKNHFQRIPAERSGNWSIKKSVHFEYFYYFVRSLINKNTVIR
ncbi:MAG TPA: polysaccharide deacetylase family protein [Prolixibacteraceae bacterium]|nr:polysaccharide deacetylase family protein [Prolixibacteraceae bacterium]